MSIHFFTRTKKLLQYCVSFFILIALYSFSVPAQAEFKTIAIGSFVDATKTVGGEIASISVEYVLYDELKNSRNYSVVKLSELPNASYAHYTLSGRIFNVQMIPFDVLLYSGIKAKVAVEMKVTDNKTGKIIMSETVYGTASAATEERVITNESYTPDVKLLLAKACIDVSNVILAKMDYMNPLIGKILKANIDEKIVYFDIGTDDNAKKGEKYIIFEDGPILTNPETGEFIAIKDNVLAELKIKDIKSNYARAKITEQYGEIKKGAKVKKVHENK